MCQMNSRAKGISPQIVRASVGFTSAFDKALQKRRAHRINCPVCKQHQKDGVRICSIAAAPTPHGGEWGLKQGSHPIFRESYIDTRGSPPVKRDEKEPSARPRMRACRSGPTVTVGGCALGQGRRYSSAGSLQGPTHGLRGQWSGTYISPLPPRSCVTYRRVTELPLYIFKQTILKFIFNGKGHCFYNIVLVSATHVEVSHRWTRAPLDHSPPTSRPSQPLRGDTEARFTQQTPTGRLCRALLRMIHAALPSGPPPCRSPPAVHRAGLHVWVSLLRCQ